MAEQKKKRQSIAESLKELKAMGTSSQSFKDTAEREKNKMLSISKNKKLSEPAKAKLNETKGVGPVSNGAAYGKNIRGSGIGPVSDGKSYARQIETKGAGPVKSGEEYASSIKPKPKPKSKPQATAPKPKPKSQVTASAKPKPKPTKPSGTQGSPMPSNPPGMRQTRGKDLREKDPQSGLYINQSKPSKSTSTPKKGAVKREGGQWKRWDGAKWVVTRSPY